jgi:WD40 repeat protein
VVHEPSLSAALDIIFVHGLGGDSQKTWSKNHNADLFWPGLWLPLEPDIGKAGILSFGYNASFRAGAPRTASNIADFSKQLLFEMAFAKNKDGEDLAIGRVPIIFVVHSMGGLVVKKAYILGQNDEDYQHIVCSISAIVFLATPHRGTNLAETLNRVLKVSFQSPRNFLADLNKSSLALEDLNEQFRHIAPKLSLFSFYETLPTAIGPKRIMVLEKDSSVLGYANEVSRALDADHHDVCKYDSPQDSNYVSVRNALKTLVNRLPSKGLGGMKNRTQDETKAIKYLLCTNSDPEEDLIGFRRWWVPGTCNWFLHEPAIQLWLDEASESQVVWFNAPPGSGKSVLSTHIITHLRESGASCQYFFFKFGDQTKRSPSTLLRSISYQIAQDVPEFRRVLVTLSAEEPDLEKAEIFFIWRKVFESILFEMHLSHALFWVIDAVDESESPKALLELFRALPRSRTKVRLLVISRKTEPLSLAFDRLSGSMRVDSVEKHGHDYNSLDIQLLVEEEMKYMRGTDRLKQQITQNIMLRASGNFLWVRLVLEEILSCHTEEAIQETLEEIPSDISKLYQRMETAILNNPRNSNRVLANALFQWAICARRSLTLLELSQALKPEFPGFIDLKRTIQDVCGQFVLVDQLGHVGIIHQTARDYLIQTSNNEIAVSTKEAHGQLFGKSISILLDPKLRYKLTQANHALQNTEPFLFYAATSWSYHLRFMSLTSEEPLNALVQLFKTPSVLAWIHSLAHINRLEVLVKAARALTTFVDTTRKLNPTKKPNSHRTSDLDLIDLWTLDLVKVVGKFNRHLLFKPLAIYKLVPLFCPSRSALHQQFRESYSARVSMSGIVNDSWSDNFARVVLPNSDRGLQITCAGRHVAVLGSTGTISIWSSSSLATVCSFHHHEMVTAICLNNKGDRLVTYGLRSSKLWAIPTGQLLSSILNPVHTKAMAIAFAENDTKILVAGNDKVIRYILTDNFDSDWQVVDPALWKDVDRNEGAVVASPMRMAFNQDATQVGVCYGRLHLSVWSLTEARCIARCSGGTKLRSDLALSSRSWFAIYRFTWNPIHGHIIGLYKGGGIFKWNPVTDEYFEVQSDADEVVASSDGKLFATSTINGTVKVWSFVHFNVIYQLPPGDLVTELAFSPDSRRLYDLRGSSVNAWEPSSLIRFSEAEESFSDSASEVQSPNLVSQISDARSVETGAVSVLAAASKLPLYCFGNEAGGVYLINTGTERPIELIRSFNSQMVTRLSWSDDGTHVAAADLLGDIMIRRLILPSPADYEASIEVQALQGVKLNLEGWGVHQIMFNHDSSLLLVVSQVKGQIWSVQEAKLLTSVLLVNGDSRKWLKHPFKKDTFIGFGYRDVIGFTWDGLKVPTLRYQEGHRRLNSPTGLEFNDDYLESGRFSIGPNGNHEPIARANKAIITQDGRHILVQSKDFSIHGVASRCLIFDISIFDVNGDGAETLKCNLIPAQLEAIIEIPLGILPGSRLTFLDQDLWMCTYELGPVYDEGALQRHYFIPRDWVTTDNLKQCFLMEDGTFLCPREDKVAAIWCSFEAGGFESV